MVEITSAGKAACRAAFNPFAYRGCGGALQHVKMVAVGVVLFPPRFLVGLVTCVVFYIACLLSVWLTKAPAADGRGRSVPVATPALRQATRYVCRVLLWCFGYWRIHELHAAADAKAERGSTEAPFSPHGAPRQSPEAAAAVGRSPYGGSAPIVVSNHVGFVEILYLGYAFGGVIGVGRHETLAAPLLRTVSQALQWMPLQRDSEESRRWAVAEMRHRARWRYEQPASRIDRHGVFAPVVVWPEGTVGNGRALLGFKPGAFLPAVPVQPIVVRLPFARMDPHWCGSANVALIMLRLACQVYNTLEAHWVPVVEPTAAHACDPVAYGEAVRERMAAATGLPLVDRGFPDALTDAALYPLGLPACTLDAVSVEDVKARIAARGLDADAVTLTKAAIRAFAASPRPPRREWDLATDGGRSEVAAAFKAFADDFVDAA